MSRPNPRKYKKSLRRKEIEDFDDEGTKIDKKFHLLLEIQQIEADIEEYRIQLSEKTTEQREKINKEIRYQQKFKPDEVERSIKVSQLPNKIVNLQETIEILEQQVSFFSSLYNNENLLKIQNEVDEQRREMARITTQIEDLNMESELRYTSPEWEEVTKRAHYSDVMNKSRISYRKELKELKKEGRRLSKEIKELQNAEDPIEEKNYQKAKLEARLSRLQKTREHKATELNQLKLRMHSKKQDLYKDEEVGDESTIFSITQNKNVL